MLILVINCGSSSAKYQLFSVRGRSFDPVGKGAIERIGDKGARLVCKHAGKSSFKKDVFCPDHYAAISIITDALRDTHKGVIKDLREISGVGHRVVHGAEAFKTSALITKSVLRSVSKLSNLAPLHNPPSVLGIKACMALLKDIPQVAVFDTSFHQTMPAYAYTYGIPYALYKRYGIRRYGFHGTSHRYVSVEAARRLNMPLKRLKLITFHLGNGCSVTAVKGGKSLDTSMGFTPLEGLLMGTRAGDFDPAIVMYLLGKRGYSLKKVGDLLNKRSGLLGISGLSNDMRDLVKASRAGNKRAALAIEIFCYRIKKYIGSYAAVMGGVDAVILTAGIGENHPWLAKKLSKELGPVLGKDVAYITIPTDEELLIAQDTYKIVKGVKRGTS